jgi:pyruvate, water dikinase
MIVPLRIEFIKNSLAEGKPAILSRSVGSKTIKMIYNDDPKSGDLVKTVDVPKEETAIFCLTDTQLEDLARQAVIIEKHYGRPMDYRMGTGW